MALDLTISPLYRIKGQEAASLPGLLALTPPRTATRGRDADRLLVYLLLAGNSSFTTSEYMQVAENAGRVFYATPGSITSALRAAGEAVNQTLLERNMDTSNRGQYALGWLTMAALREAQCTFLLSGPMHIHHYGQGSVRHIFEPAVSGKGLGMSQAAAVHYAQTPMQAGDRLVFCGRMPNGWETALADSTPTSLASMRRRLTLLTGDDLNAVLIQASEGSGAVNLLKGNAAPPEEKEAAQPAASPAPPRVPVPAAGRPRRAQDPAPSDGNHEVPAHLLQPSAYAIPFQRDEPRPGGPRDFPASIPRAGPRPPEAAPPPAEPAAGKPSRPRRRQASPAADPSPGVRQAARIVVGGIQGTRRALTGLVEKLRHFLPRLLPDRDSREPLASAETMMAFIAVLVPLIVVTIASVVYLRLGRSQQYDTYLAQAQEKRAQAVALTDPVEQRKAWEYVLLSVVQAESHRQTSETVALRQEAEANLDALLGITRLPFQPAFSSNLGIDISRMAASETDLFLLNAANGEVLRAQPAAGGRGFQVDTAFNCRPGVYGSYTVGPLVDILAMPTLNSINATLLGIDADGNLLYCAPGQVAQAIPLPLPDTNWGRVTAFVLDGGNLYVLDAPSRAVWVYNGRDGTFVDRPYFFFGQQTPTQDVIDLIVSADELYMLHADGHLSNCSYSRIEAKPSQCRDPYPMVNPFRAYQDVDLFGAAHFTQMLQAAPPDQALLLLDADAQGVMRFAPRSLELLGQYRPQTGAANPIPPGPAGAMTVSPAHVMYLAVDGQVYFALTP